MSDLRISGASASARTETDIRLNYVDPSKVIAAANDANSFAEAVFLSTDGGATWNPSLTNLPLAAGDAGQSDPAVDWTSDGTAWALCIGFDAAQTNLQVRAYQSTDNGANWTLDGTPSGTQNGADREIIWVDHSPTSPFRDQIYATWHNGVPVFFSRRTGGAWQAPIQLSGAETTVLGIGGDIKTNSFGDVFVFWPDADGSRNILVAKSTDGGATFGAPVVIATTFATTRRLSIPADSGRKARVYVSAGAFRTATKDLVYAVWSDLSGESGCTSGGGPGTNVSSTCKTRVWFSRSTDGGATWSAPVMLNNQASLNDQFHSKLAVDDSTGNLIVIYDDTVADPGRLQTDIWMQTSTDDGQTWSSATKVTSARSDETTAGANLNQYGDYNGLSGFAGTFFPSWTDRRSGGPEEIWTAAISLKITPVITWNPATLVYGTPLGPAQLNATVSPAIPGTFTYSPPAGTCLPAGTQTLNVTFTPNDTVNFNTATASVSLTVLKATPIINWSNPPDIDFGTPLDNTQLDASATWVVCGNPVTVAGTFTYTPGAGTVLPVGTQTLCVTFTPTDTANYNNANACVQINVLTGHPIILSCSFAPTTLQREERVQVIVLVKNDSVNSHSTQGPDPGFEYSEGDTFQTKGFPSVAGAYRFAVDLDMTPYPYKVHHLYRWGFGHTLAPGEVVSVNGFIRFHNSRENAPYYVGMIEEVDNVLLDHQCTTPITVERP